MTSEDARKITTWLQVCADETESMTEWEVGFITSVSDQFERTQFISKKQYEKLEVIYNKIV